MTVEAKETKFEKRFLRKNITHTKTRVVDYRKTTQQLGEDGVIIHSRVDNDTFLLHLSPGGRTKHARVLSDNEVEVFRLDNLGHEIGHSEIHVKDGINRAGLRNEDGSLVLSWRETIQGDYPNEIPGIEIDPEQVTLNLET